MYPAATGATNGMAVASLILSLIGFATCITAPIGAILGHVARKQIRERGESGDGLALGGIIVGWILTAISIGVIVLFVVAAILASEEANSTYSLQYLCCSARSLVSLGTVAPLAG
jgi:hypothetical protein